MKKYFSMLLNLLLGMGGVAMLFTDMMPVGVIAILTGLVNFVRAAEENKSSNLVMHARKENEE